MIADHIKHHAVYEPLGTRIRAGLEFLAGVRADGFADHREEILGTDVFALFQSYVIGETSSYYEAHRSHIDIQFVVEGVEVIKVADLAGLSIHTPYNAEKDVAFYDPAPGSLIRLSAGEFAVLYPHDAHLPKLPAFLSEGPAGTATAATGRSPQAVKKVVIKVRV